VPTNLQSKLAIPFLSVKKSLPVLLRGPLRRFFLNVPASDMGLRYDIGFRDLARTCRPFGEADPLDYWEMVDNVSSVVPPLIVCWHGKQRTGVQATRLETRTLHVVM
jgi:hypothetical protein